MASAISSLVKIHYAAIGALASGVARVVIKGKTRHARKSGNQLSVETTSGARGQ